MIVVRRVMLEPRGRLGKQPFPHVRSGFDLPRLRGALCRSRNVGQQREFAAQPRAAVRSPVAASEASSGYTFRCSLNRVGIREQADWQPWATFDRDRVNFSSRSKPLRWWRSSIPGRAIDYLVLSRPIRHRAITATSDAMATAT